MSKNHFIDLDPAYTEIDESPKVDIDGMHDEISRKFSLLAKQKDNLINKKKHNRHQKVWSRRNSNQFEFEQDKVKSV